ncbi:hypothetical protein GCM10009810_00080 [Nostocoides vanveenii]|uniref:Type I-U CRISPR-associated protein Cas7 n=2 Tax=Nostocoides vanveenii TaxID=330835 RepID=A0ABN2JY48_9MICO
MSSDGVGFSVPKPTDNRAGTERAMNQLTVTTLTEACRPGGSSVLTLSTELAPAAGESAGIAPARFVRGREGTYAFETRYETAADGSGAAVRAVVIDSKGSSLNRVETAIMAAIRDGHPVLSRVPRLEVDYGRAGTFTDLELPHRFADGHLRAGTIDGKPTTDNPQYRALRDCTALNARPLLEASPGSLVFGAWDSTRKSQQVRFRSALVGETIGFLADQVTGSHIDPRGAARWDTVAPSVRLKAEDMRTLLAQLEPELSPGNVAAIRKEIDKAGKGTVSAAALGLGAIPPSLNGLGLVSCRRVLRHHVLSFSALRQLRFGLGTDGDTAARALLAAYALCGLTRSYAEVVYRANCDLVEKGCPTMVLDRRFGETEEFDALTEGVADALLEEALTAAGAFGVRWEGHILRVKGNPLISVGEASEEDEGA